MTAMPFLEASGGGRSDAEAAAVAFCREMAARSAEFERQRGNVQL
jgi:hypothetical protein